MDNAPMESFFHTSALSSPTGSARRSRKAASLKTEHAHHRIYPTRAEARSDLFGSMGGSSDFRCLHSALSYLSLIKAERRAS